TKASNAFEAGDEPGGMQHLHNAQLFLRGTSASMWYANNFPFEIYKNHVRPAMMKADTPDGLSGELNTDYNFMKAAIDCLEKVMFRRYGRDFNGWPDSIYNSYHEFGSVYVEDMQHHTLIAVSKVGTDTSLAQKAWQADLPAHIRKKKAADVLREMMDL